MRIFRRRWTPTPTLCPEWGRLPPRRLKRHLCSLLLLPKAPGDSAEGFRFPAISRIFRGALGRTRTCDLLIRSHSPSETETDKVGQGETKPHVYRGFSIREGTG